MDFLIIKVAITFGAGLGVLCLFVWVLKSHSLEQIEGMSKRRGLALFAVMCVAFFVVVGLVFSHSERALDFLTIK